MTGPARSARPGEAARPGQDAEAAGPAIDETVTVATAGQMRLLGQQLAAQLRAGDLIVLSGSLGAGKTTLTQGIGAGLGVRGAVTSPTFVIARLHPSLSAGPDLVHADAYRLGSRAEVDDLDLDADLATSVTVVEWGEGLVEELAPSFLSVSIRADEPPPAGGSQAAVSAAGGGQAAVSAAGGGQAAVSAAGGSQAAVSAAGGSQAAVSAAGGSQAAVSAGGGDQDARRTVRVRGWGERWRGAAADAIRGALSSLG